MPSHGLRECSSCFAELECFDGASNSYCSGLNLSMRKLRTLGQYSAKTMRPDVRTAAMMRSVRLA